jgi:two-component system, OmpR family, sensor histidine kinase KdpD
MARVRSSTALRVVVPALLLPAAVTALAALPTRISTASAAMAYVLAVIGAALVGGSAAGLAASALSFLALNFFFTPPLHTFNVGKPEDLVALVVFLLVSAAVGALVSRANAQRQRAERREREARLLQHLGTRLLSGDSPGSVFESFGRALVDLTGLARYEVIIEPDGRLGAEAGQARGEDMTSEDFPLSVGAELVGTVRIYSTTDAPSIGDEERHLIRTFTSQMALALEGKRLADVARDAQVDAERSGLQAALFSSVTHDLRTPLAAITASVTGLQDPDARLGPEARRDLLETIRQEAHRLNRLVGNLMDLSRLRAGALVPSKRPTPIDEVVEAVLARMEPQLQGHRLNVALRDDIPEVPADVVQLDQALTNILENAAKFSAPGSQITIQAARWQDSVQVRVADQGTRIPPELRERVFEPFVRGDGEAAGTGLGLAIARAVVVAHGGTIRIEDAPGGGTAVVFRLPLREPSA